MRVFDRGGLKCYLFTPLRLKKRFSRKECQRWFYYFSSTLTADTCLVSKLIGFSYRMGLKPVLLITQAKMAKSTLTLWASSGIQR